MNQLFGVEAATNVVLSVSPHEEDCVALERIFKSEWAVIRCATVVSALSALREIPVPIVICDCDGTPGAWVEMLDQVPLLPDPHF